jgi:hypothetical protein
VYGSKNVLAMAKATSYQLILKEYLDFVLFSISKATSQFLKRKVQI